MLLYARPSTVTSQSSVRYSSTLFAKCSQFDTGALTFLGGQRRVLYSQTMRDAVWNLRGLTLLACSLMGSQLGVAQGPEVTPSTKPIPDIPTLMHEVEAHQQASEALVKNYLYHSFALEQSLDGKDGVKKTETEDSDIFYVAGARIRRILKKNGKDLTPDEERKESERIDKEIARAKDGQHKKDESERDVVTVSRFLELGRFINPRRVTLAGRDTIAVDFAGDPKAKTRTRFEGAIREMEGTVWIDEQDRSLRKLQGHFVHAFKVGGGLLADVKEGSSFEAEWTKVNGEVWLPSSVAGEGSIRVMLLLNFHGALRVSNSNYRKFKATSTILPIVSAPGPTPDREEKPVATPSPAIPQ